MVGLPNKKQYKKNNKTKSIKVLDNTKTSADVKKEGEILTEMLEIGAKRDSLIALLEEERQRWCRPLSPTLSALTTMSANPLQYLINYPNLSNASDTSTLFALFAILIAYLISLHITETLIVLTHN